MHNYRKLQVWQRAMDFTIRLYKETANFPTDEKFGLTSQLRRASVSVPLNIAEGSGSDTNKDFGRFLSYAVRSGYETATAIFIARGLGYLTAEQTEALFQEIDEIIAMTIGLRRSLPIN